MLSSGLGGMVESAHNFERTLTARLLMVGSAWERHQQIVLRHPLPQIKVATCRLSLSNFHASNTSSARCVCEAKVSIDAERRVRFCMRCIDRLSAEEERLASNF